MPAYIYANPESYAVSTTGNQTITGSKTFQAGSATSVALIVQGATDQSQNIMEWRNAAGTPVAKVHPSGEFWSTAFVAGNSVPAGPGGIKLQAGPEAANQIGIVVNGATGQTANLQEWRAAYTIVGRITPGGSLVNTVSNTTFAAVHAKHTGASGISLFGESGAASALPLLIRGHASQTANLQQWQDNAGSVLAFMDAAGNLSAAAFGAGGWTTSINARIHSNPVAGQIGVVVRGATGQTANLTEWQNSAGSVLAAFKADGTLSLGNRAGQVAWVYDGGTAGNRSGFGTDMSGNGNELSIFTNSSGAGAIRAGNYSGTTFVTQHTMTTGSYSQYIIAGRAGQAEDYFKIVNNAGATLGFFNANREFGINGPNGNGVKYTGNLSGSFTLPSTAPTSITVVIDGTNYKIPVYLA